MLFPPRKLIGICGAPTHGKSTVQKFLEDEYGLLPVDDGKDIRLLAMERHGLTWDDVSTQKGKLKEITVAGRVQTVREVLGNIGNEFERQDPNYWINLTLSQLMPHQTRVSFGSVRRRQGDSIKRAGGLIIEVRDPRKPDSPHEFDSFDRTLVDRLIINDGSVDDLRQKVSLAVRFYLENSPVLDREAYANEVTTALTEKDVEIIGDC